MKNTLYSMQSIFSLPFGPVRDAKQVNILKTFLTDLNVLLQTSKSGKLLPDQWAIKWHEWQLNLNNVQFSHIISFILV